MQSNKFLLILQTIHKLWMNELILLYIIIYLYINYFPVADGRDCPYVQGGMETAWRSKYKTFEFDHNIQAPSDPKVQG